MTALSDTISNMKAMLSKLENELDSSKDEKAILFRSLNKEKLRLEKELSKINDEISSINIKLSDIKANKLFGKKFGDMLVDIDYYKWSVDTFDNSYWNDSSNIELIISAPPFWESEDCYNWIIKNKAKLWPEMIEHIESQSYNMDIDIGRAIDSIIDSFDAVRNELKANISDGG